MTIPVAYMTLAVDYKLVLLIEGVSEISTARFLEVREVVVGPKSGGERDVL